MFFSSYLWVADSVACEAAILSEAHLDWASFLSPLSIIMLLVRLFPLEQLPEAWGCCGPWEPGLAAWWSEVVAEKKENIKNHQVCRHMNMKLSLCASKHLILWEPGCWCPCKRGHWRTSLFLLLPVKSSGFGGHSVGLFAWGGCRCLPSLFGWDSWGAWVL